MTRQERIALLEALEQRVRQFRRDESIWPFRRPHEPLDFSSFIQSTLGSASSSVIPAVRSRTVLAMEWAGGGTWSSWVITLPSGIHVYCDSDGIEDRVLASVKRGSAEEADRFFLELLAESRGRHFGIEMTGGMPARVRTTTADREFLTDVFVEIFEETDAEAEIRSSSDFRHDVAQWLSDVLVAPPPQTRAKRYRRLRDEPSHL